MQVYIKGKGKEKSMFSKDQVESHPDGFQSSLSKCTCPDSIPYKAVTSLRTRSHLSLTVQQKSCTIRVTSGLQRLRAVYITGGHYQQCPAVLNDKDQALTNPTSVDVQFHSAPGDTHLTHAFF